MVAARPARRPGLTIGAALYASPPAELTEFRTSLEALRGIPGTTLRRLTAQTLDLATHRLDAWVTSLATRRLGTVNPGRPDGVYLGAYGWVEDLTPAQAGAQGYGYIHAPSDSQAVTAAVLKTAELSSSQISPPDPSVAVHLPSARLRGALWLLDGVRQGQPLGALLGYRFERRLRDTPPLAVHIPAFRSHFGMQGVLVTPEGAAQGTSMGSPVTDGLALHAAWCPVCGHPTLTLDALGIPEADRPGLHTVLDQLHDLIDAVGDVALTESVHHVVSGRPDAAGALTALLNGQGPPPQDFDAFRTPRSGAAVSYRLFLASNRRWPADIEHWPQQDGRPQWPPQWPLTATGSDPAWAGWPALDAEQARAYAEPALNALAADLLPKPHTVQCHLTWPTGTPPDDPPEPVTLDTLPLSPLDYVFIARDTPPEQAASRTELGLRLLDRLAAQHPEPPCLDFGRDPGWPPEVLSVTEFLEAARALATLLLSSRPLQLGDLIAPGADASPPTFSELTDRAANAVRRLDATLDALTDPSSVAQGLRMAAGLGVPDSFPDPALDPAQLAARAARAAEELRNRQHRLPADPAGQLAGVFGADGSAMGRFPLLPSIDSTTVGDLAEQVNRSSELQEGDELQAITWLHRAARVRAGARQALDAAIALEALTGHSPQLTVMQPQGPTRWLALPQPVQPNGNNRPVGGRSLVMQTPPGVPASGIFRSAAVGESAVLSGILVDEWTEVLSASSETTSVAVRAETPNSCAPQTVLLAVAPAGATQWTPEALEQTLHDTLDLVHCRTVDPGLLASTPVGGSGAQDPSAGLGQLLPALCVGFNSAGEAISTDLFGSGDG